MIGGPPFPISIAELDCDTLSLAIGAPVQSFESHRIGADRGMLGEIFVVSLVYDDQPSAHQPSAHQPSSDQPGAHQPSAHQPSSDQPGAHQPSAHQPSSDQPGAPERPATVICKFAALRDEALASALRARTNERELRCYDELLAATHVATPHFYGCWYDQATAHFLLVQEAIETDTAVDQVAGINPALTAMVAAEAAELHHGHWQDPSLTDMDWLPRLDAPMRLDNLSTLATAGWAPLCDLLGDEFTDADRRLGDEFPGRLRVALETLAALPSTLIHSDLRADNLLFSPDHQSVALIDWQGAGIGPGSFDIAYLLAHSLSVLDRRTHEDELIDGYLWDLAAAGTHQDRADFMTGFALAHHYGLAVACALPLISDSTQPRVKALAGAMARRSIEALRDHGQLWS